MSGWTIASGESSDLETHVDLKIRNYGQIEKLVLASNPNKPSAAIKLDLGNRSQILGKTYGSYDFNFARQLGAVSLGSTLVDEKITVPADTYLFTAYSAIPLADLVRSYFSVLALPIPRIGYIRTGHSAVAEYASDPTKRAAELTRLTDVLSGSEHICVVDQYVTQGCNLRTASSLLQDCGVKIASAIRGKWYWDVARSDLDIEECTSTHKQFMAQVGVSVANDK